MREVNLIPYEVALREELYSRLRLWFVILAGVALLIFACVMTQKYVVEKIEHEVQQLERRNRSLKVRYTEVKELQKKQEELISKARIVQVLLSKRSFTKLLIALEQSMTPSIWLNSIELEKNFLGRKEEIEGQWEETGYFIVKKPGLQQKTLKKSSDFPEVTLKGISLSHDDLAQFLHSLNVSILFHDVKLRYCQPRVKEKGEIEFKINAKLIE